MMMTPCHSPLLRAALASLKCICCDERHDVTIVNDEWCLTHAIALCRDCRRDLENEQDPEQRRKRINDWNLKQARRLLADVFEYRLPVEESCASTEK